MAYKRATGQGGMVRVSIQVDPVTLKRIDEQAALEEISRSFAFVKLARLGLQAKQDARHRAAS